MVGGSHRDRDQDLGTVGLRLLVESALVVRQREQRGSSRRESRLLSAVHRLLHPERHDLFRAERERGELESPGQRGHVDDSDQCPREQDHQVRAFPLQRPGRRRGVRGFPRGRTRVEASLELRRAVASQGITVIGMARRIMGRLVAVVSLISAACAATAEAQNRGVYPLGMTAIQSGVTPPSGVTYVNQLLFYSRDHAKDDAGHPLPVTGANDVLMDMNTFAWV